LSIVNYNHGKFFGPVQVYSGYIFILFGFIAVTYSLTSLFLLIPGTFMAFTYSGTIIDTDKKRIRPYTNISGLIRTGKWIDVSVFTRFCIQKTTKKYSSYSRGSVRFDMDITTVNLLIQNHKGTRKVVINRYSGFEEAQKEKEKLSEILLPEINNVNI